MRQERIDRKWENKIVYDSREEEEDWEEKKL